MEKIKQIISGGKDEYDNISSSTGRTGGQDPYASNQTGSTYAGGNQYQQSANAPSSQTAGGQLNSRDAAGSYAGGQSHLGNQTGIDTPSAAVGSTSTYSTTHLRHGDPTASVVDNQSRDPLTYRKPEAYHTGASDGSAFPSSSTVPGANQARGTGQTAQDLRQGADHIPGAFPTGDASSAASPQGTHHTSGKYATGGATHGSGSLHGTQQNPSAHSTSRHDNPYQAQNLDPRVDNLPLRSRDETNYSAAPHTAGVAHASNASSGHPSTGASSNYSQSSANYGQTSANYGQTSNYGQSSANYDQRSNYSQSDRSQFQDSAARSSAISPDNRATSGAPGTGAGHGSASSASHLGHRDGAAVTSSSGGTRYTDEASTQLHGGREHFGRDVAAGAGVGGIAGGIAGAGTSGSHDHKNTGGHNRYPEDASRQYGNAPSSTGASAASPGQRYGDRTTQDLGPSARQSTDTPTSTTASGYGKSHSGGVEGDHSIRDRVGAGAAGLGAAGAGAYGAHELNTRDSANKSSGYGSASPNYQQDPYSRESGKSEQRSNAPSGTTEKERLRDGKDDKDRYGKPLAGASATKGDDDTTGQDGEKKPSLLKRIFKRTNKDGEDEEYEGEEDGTDDSRTANTAGRDRETGASHLKSADDRSTAQHSQTTSSPHSSNQQSSYGQPSSQQSSYGQSSNQQSSYGQTSNQQPSYGQTSNQQPSYGQTSNQQPSYGQTSNQQSSYGQPYDTQPSRSQPSSTGNPTGHTSTNQSSTIPSSSGYSSASQQSTTGHSARSTNHPSTGQSSAGYGSTSQPSVTDSSIGHQHSSAQPSSLGTAGLSAAGGGLTGFAAQQGVSHSQTPNTSSSAHKSSAQSSSGYSSSQQPSTGYSSTQQPSTGYSSSQQSSTGHSTHHPSTGYSSAQQSSSGYQSSADQSSTGYQSSQQPYSSQPSTQPNAHSTSHHTSDRGTAATVGTAVAAGAGLAGYAAGRDKETGATHSSSAHQSSQHPSASQSTSGYTSAYQPSTTQSSTAHSSTGYQSSHQPSAGHSSAGYPSSQQSAAGYQAAQQPSSGYSSTGQQPYQQASTGHSSSDYQSSQHPSSGYPSTGYQSSQQPSAGHSSTGYQPSQQPSKDLASTGYQSTRSAQEPSTTHSSSGYQSSQQPSTGHASSGYSSAQQPSSGYASTGYESNQQPSTGHSSGYQSGQQSSTGHTTGYQSGQQPSTGNSSTGYQSGQQPSTGNSSTGYQSNQQPSTGHSSGYQSGQQSSTGHSTGYQSGQQPSTGPSSSGYQSGEQSSTGYSSPGYQSGQQSSTTNPSSGYSSTHQPTTQSSSGYTSTNPQAQPPSAHQQSASGLSRSEGKDGFEQTNAGTSRTGAGAAVGAAAGAAGLGAAGVGAATAAGDSSSLGLNDRSAAETDKNQRNRLHKDPPGDHSASNTAADKKDYPNSPHDTSRHGETAGHHESAIDCKQPIPVKGKKYDFSHLDQVHTLWSIDDSEKPVITNTTWKVNICRPLKYDKEEGKQQCPLGSNNPDHEGEGDQVFIPVAGSFAAESGKSSEPKWTNLNNENAKDDILELELKGGKYQKIDTRAVIKFQCDPSTSGNTDSRGDGDNNDSKEKRNEDEGKKNEGKSSGGDLTFVSFEAEGDESGKAYWTLRLNWKTKYVCEHYDDDSDKSKGWGFFTWFILILFLGIASYLIFGSWLNYNRYGARGWDLVPHGDTIRDIPYLVKDWGRKVVDTVTGPGSRGGYAAV
ncbi:hypothetical protein DV738_g5472, partial [Chaetothyriales sp. CBS 135597]